MNVSAAPPRTTDRINLLCVSGAAATLHNQFLEFLPGFY